MFGRLEGSWPKARRSDKDRTDLAETKTHRPWDNVISLTEALTEAFAVLFPPDTYSNLYPILRQSIL